MRKLAALLLIGTAPVLTPAMAVAQNSATGPDPIIVTGDNRIVCRRVTRTATRMHTGRMCRPLSEWRSQSRQGPPVEHYSDETIDEAAQTLDGLHADDVSTGCGYEGHETVLGPRK